MAQAWTDNCYQADHEAQTDLANMENNFTAIKSMFSGAAAPANTVAGMPWFDTTQKAFKQRNNADSAWLGIMHGDTSQKMWVYRDSAMDGWAVDGTPTDRVLALKGGATYTTGGASAGTWTQPTHVHGVSHTHTITHTHNVVLPETGWSSGYGGTGGRRISVGSETRVDDRTIASAGSSAANTGAASISNTAAGGTVNTWRPAASVGTLQYLDL